MPVLRTSFDFDEVLNLARQVRSVRFDLVDFDQERLRMYPDLTKDWEGGVRDEFDELWAVTANEKGSAIEQLGGHETDLAEMWRSSVEAHNDKSYEIAVRQSRDVIDAAREDHNLLQQTADLVHDGFDKINPFNSDDYNVHRIDGSVSAPTEASNFAPGSSFVHYERSGNDFYGHRRSFPDPSVSLEL